MNATTPSPPNGTTQEDIWGVLKDYSTFPVTFTALLVTLFTATFVMNVTASHALYRTTRLRPSVRVLLFNLAVSDAVAGLVNVYHIIIVRLDISFSGECIFRYALLTELTVVTLFFVLVLSVDRVVALVFALRYDVLVTPRRLWALSALVWTLSVLIPVAGLAGVDMGYPYCVYQLFMPRYAFLLFGTGCMSVTVVIAGLNLFTLHKSLGHIKSIAANVVGEGREARVAAMNHKAALTSLAVSVPFLVLCSPLHVLFFVFWAWPPLTRTQAGLVAISVCLGLVVTNSLLNPLIYVWRSAEVRKEVKRSLQCFGGLDRWRGNGGGGSGAPGGSRSGDEGAKRSFETVETVCRSVSK